LYSDAQTVVWLNRNLSEARQVNLLDFGLDAVDAVAYAPAEGLWVYAPDRQRLLQIDRNGEPRYESVELSQVFGRAIRAVEIVATPRQVAMSTEDGRILLFGPFGAYRTQLLRPGRQLLANDDRLLFHEGAEWFTYAGDDGLVQPIRQPSSGAELVAPRAEFALWRQGPRWWVE